MKKIVIVVLFAAALGFSATPSHAWSEFVKELAGKACSHLNSNGKKRMLRLYRAACPESGKSVECSAMV